MIDIVAPSEEGLDQGVVFTDTTRAANLLSVQLNSLNFAPELGIDFDYFLREDLEIQNESFRGYLVEVLSERGISVISIITEVESLYQKFTMNIKDQETSSDLLVR